MSAPATSSAQPYLSVVIPAYNEEARIPDTIRGVEAFMATKDYSWELVVVDDGSRDRTVEISRSTFSRPESRVICNPRNMGKGATVRNGMLDAGGAMRLFTDADNSTPIEEIDKLLARMEATKCGVAIGSRALDGSQVELHQPFYREFMGRTFNKIVQALAVPGIMDTQCGFKLFTEKAAQYVFKRQRMDGFSFDVEALMLARRGGFKIEEVPVRWVNSPASRVSPILDSARMFRDVVRIRFSKYD